MRIEFFTLTVVFAAMLAGCSSNTATPLATTNADPAATTAETGDSETPSGDEFALTSENTHIQFIGTHVGPVPDPKARVGTFEDVKGTASISGGELTSVSVEIQMASVSTPMEKLTNHLQAPDFFDVRSFPTAEFVSTSITKKDDGNYSLVGNLTLHGETKEIEMVGIAEVSDGNLDLKAEVEIDRSEFGMDQNLDKVNKEVPLTIGVGKYSDLNTEATP